MLQQLALAGNVLFAVVALASLGRPETPMAALQAPAPPIREPRNRRVEL